MNARDARTDTLFPQMTTMLWDARYMDAVERGLTDEESKAEADDAVLHMDDEVITLDYVVEDDSWDQPLVEPPDVPASSL